MARNSIKYVLIKIEKAFCADFRQIYLSATVREGIDKLEAFAEKRDKKYQMISKSWSTHWDNLNEFFGYPDEIRMVIYTTIGIESLNYRFKKVTKN